MVALTRIVTARKPRLRRLPKATAEATPASTRIVGKPRPVGTEISTEEHTRRGDAAEELFRELVHRASGA
jgi:hypothetical protein